MTFINPIELLDLAKVDLCSIDNTVIKKAKKKVITEIDLSEDELYNYKGQRITKSDCERVINELDIDERKEFYFYLTTNNALNDFLAIGDEKIFSSLKQDSIYKLPNFIDFVSIPFSERFDKSLLSAFKANDFNKFVSILRTQYLIKRSDIDNSFKSVTKEIQIRIAEINTIKQDITDGQTLYTEDTIDDTFKIVKANFPIEIINSLPQYFQSQINKIASIINSLQIAIDENFISTKLPLDLMDYTLLLNIESVGKPTFLNNREILNKRHTANLEKEKHAHLLKKWIAILSEIIDLTKKVDEKKILPHETIIKIETILNVHELNNLPSFADEFRNEIGYALRSLSISSWDIQNDIKSALILLKLALQINISYDVKEKIKKDETTLKDFEKKYKGILTCYFCEKNIPDKQSEISKTIYLVTNRSRFLNSRRVQYSTSQISIPRCKECAAIHSTGDDRFYLIFISCLIAGGIIGGVAVDSNSLAGGLIGGGAIGGLFGWIFGKSMENSFASQKGSKDASNSTLANHPILIDRIKQGWTFSKPSA